MQRSSEIEMCVSIAKTLAAGICGQTFVENAGKLMRYMKPITRKAVWLEVYNRIDKDQSRHEHIEEYSNHPMVQAMATAIAKEIVKMEKHIG